MRRLLDRVKYGNSFLQVLNVNDHRQQQRDLVSNLFACIDWQDKANWGKYGQNHNWNKKREGIKGRVSF